MAGDEMERVIPLGQLDDFAVAEGDPDVRGWSVLGSDGETIGEVDELLIDSGAMKVRYLDVDVEAPGGSGAGDRHVLIPIGYARLDRERDRVLVDVLNGADLRAVPAYDQGPLTREYETAVRDRFATAAAAEGPAVAEDDFYAGNAFDEARFYGRDADPAARLGEDWHTRRVGQVGDL